MIASPPDEPAGGARPIQDNSFLIEEAYNQDDGVVQHIHQFVRSNGSGDWIGAFTQEWPASGVRHQLSYTLAAARSGGANGAGDAALNYRYQLVGDGAARVAVAPRFSLLLPTGRSSAGLGAGGAGFQTGVPVSLLLSDDWVVHGNAGLTWTPSARNPRGQRAGLVAWNGGASVIWLRNLRWNPMLETIYVGGETVEGPGRVAGARSFFVSPGVRWAWNFPSGLQIVPGLAMPVGLGPSRGSRQVLLYLSFEHPFGRERAAQARAEAP